MQPHDTSDHSNTSLTPARLLTTDQVANALGLSSRTLAAWRSSRGNSLPYIKTGSRVRYRSQDVVAWLETQLRSPAKTAGDRT